MKTKFLFFFLALFCIMGYGQFKQSTVTMNEHAFMPKFTSNAAWLQNHIHTIQLQAPNLNPEILKLGLTAFLHARKLGLDKKELLTIIDFTKPSSARRMWVIDLKSSKVLFNTWVSHGKNSGNAVASSFSNLPGSRKSSLGLFVTSDPYMGGHGYSLRLKGLEAGVNDNAYRRAVVIHGAWYADGSVVSKYGQLGRSFGCPAVSSSIATSLINAIKNNTLVFAYYPDKRWLSHSAFLLG